MSQHVFVDAHELVEVSVSTKGIKNFFGFGLFDRWKKAWQTKSIDVTVDPDQKDKHFGARNDAFVLVKGEKPSLAYVNWQSTTITGDPESIRLLHNEHAVDVVDGSVLAKQKYIFFVEEGHRFVPDLGAFSRKRDVLVCVSHKIGSSSFELFFFDPTTHGSQMKHFKLENTEYFTRVEDIFDIKFVSDERVVLFCKGKNIVIQLIAPPKR